MVCNRRLMVVRQEFEKAGLRPARVKLGEVKLSNGWGRKAVVKAL